MSTEPTQISAEGLADLKAELEHLEGTRRKEISERIKIARDFGDLKENSEYHDAKNRQAHLETKILRLRERQRNAVVVEAATGGSTAVLGVTVTMRDLESGRETRNTLVGAAEADPAHGRLSIESPLGRALAGARVGDQVTFAAPRGERHLEIVALD